MADALVGLVMFDGALALVAFVVFDGVVALDNALVALVALDVALAG